MAHIKVGSLIRVEWDVHASEYEYGTVVDPGEFDGRVLSVVGRQILAEFSYPGVRKPDRIVIDLGQRTDLTNKAVISSVKVLRE